MARAAKESTEDEYTPTEAALRRDAIIKNMIATPPTPHKPKVKVSRGSRATCAKAKKRGPSA